MAQPVKAAAIEAIQNGLNRYTETQGIAALRNKITDLTHRQLPNWSGSDFGTLVTSGVSGGLLLT